eukprot:1138029-Pelagomonas_calceolata.AAC.2
MSIWGLVGWRSKTTFLRVAHPVVKSHGGAGKAMKVAFKAFVCKIVLHLNSLPSRMPIAHGSSLVLQRICVFQILGTLSGEHMQGSPSAHQACPMLGLKREHTFDINKAPLVLRAVTNITGAQWVYNCSIEKEGNEKLRR